MEDINFKRNETFDTTDQAREVNAPPPIKRSKKVTYAIVGASLLVVVAIVTGVVIATTAGSTNENNDKQTSKQTSLINRLLYRDNVISCNMTQMEPVTGQIFSMAPANMNMTNDMMTMDSMMLSFVAQDQDPVVFMKMSSEKITMDSGATQTMWHGAMMGDGSFGFATLVESADRTMSGTFTTADAAYSIMTDPDGIVQVKMTRWADFPPELDDIAGNETATNNTMRTTDDFVAESSNAPMAMNGTIVSNMVDTVRTVVSSPFGGRRLRSSRELQTSTARVLLVVTNAARCEYAGLSAGCAYTSSNNAPFAGRVPLLEAEMNNAMQSVGVNAAIQIVDVRYLKDGNQYGPNRDTTAAMRSSEYFNQRRSDAQADLVALITGSDGEHCGIGGYDNWYSATRHDCLDQFTFSHELGHNYACDHDRGSSDDTHAYAHGYHDPNGEFRTMMAYSTPCGGCQRLPFFSAADGYTYNERPIGTSSENNARRLSENAGRVAGFF